MGDHYAYRITWSAEDGEHVGLCAEFPSLSWLAATPGEALSGIQRLVADCVDDMRANDEPVPEPMADRNLQRKVHGAGAAGDAPRPGHSGVGAGSEYESPGECPAGEGRLNKRAGDPVLSPGEVDELPAPHPRQEVVRRVAIHDCRRHTVDPFPIGGSREQP